MTIKEGIFNRLQFKKSNFNTFLVFLTFTTLLWLLMKFSKNYTQEIISNVSYVNIPEDKFLNKKNDTILNLVLTGSGFQLMNYRFFPPKIIIDVKKYAVLNARKGYFLPQQHRELLKSQLDYDGEIKEMSTDTLHFLLDINKQKKIPIELRANISFASGYASKEGLVLVPDSVIVNGPSHVVDTTTVVHTLPVVLEGINEDQEVQVKLDVQDFSSELEILSDNVEGIIEVNKFTEGTLSLPIQLINTPKNTKVNIFPKTVTVVYRVSLKVYKSITASDFKVVADYRNKDASNAFIPLKIKKKSRDVQNLRLQDRQVQFVIVK